MSIVQVKRSKEEIKISREKQALDYAFNQMPGAKTSAGVINLWPFNGTQGSLHLIRSMFILTAVAIIESLSIHL